MTDLLYSFDASALINGRRDLLPPEVFPTLWTKIEGMVAAGAVRSVDMVREELGRKDDATKEWASTLTDMFLPLDADIQVVMALNDLGQSCSPKFPTRWRWTLTVRIGVEPPRV